MLTLDHDPQPLLLVSQQHRMLISDWRAEIDRLFPDLHSEAQEEWLTARPVARQFKAALLN